jgi:Calcineurin-like phosphoesterase
MPPYVRLIGASLASVSMAALVACGGGGQPMGPAVPTAGTERAIATTPPERPADPVPNPTDDPPPIGTGTAVLVGAGDVGECGSPGTAQTARLIQDIQGQVFLTGDLGYPNGRADDLRRCFDPDFGKFRSRWRPVPGNHEYDMANAGPFYDYFGGSAGPDRRGYYSFRAASWLVLMLNSNIPTGRGSLQFEWAANELRTQRARCTLAMWHHPFATSGPNGPSNFMRDMWQLLIDFDADVVVNGHDHMYERFAPFDRDYRQNPINGMRQFIAGTGGGTLYLPATRAPNSELVLSRFGVLKLTLEPGFYEWDFIDATTRASADRGQDQCH